MTISRNCIVPYIPVPQSNFIDRLAQTTTRLRDWVEFSGTQPSVAHVFLNLLGPCLANPRFTVIWHDTRYGPTCGL